MVCLLLNRSHVIIQFVQLLVNIFDQLIVNEESDQVPQSLDYWVLREVQIKFLGGFYVIEEAASFLGHLHVFSLEHVYQFVILVVVEWDEKIAAFDGWEFAD